MNRWEKFLSNEMDIEQKSPLYCYTIMFFYLGFRLLSGSFSASVWAVAGIIIATYLMGYVQLYLLGRFDEAGALTGKVVLKAVLCSLIYTAVSWLCGWFDRSPVVTAVFFFFMLGCYGCVYWFFSIKRTITTKQMNDELAAFKQKAKEKQP